MATKLNVGDILPFFAHSEIMYFAEKNEIVIAVLRITIEEIILIIYILYVIL